MFTLSKVDFFHFQETSPSSCYKKKQVISLSLFMIVVSILLLSTLTTLGLGMPWTHSKLLTVLGLQTRSSIRPSILLYAAFMSLNFSYPPRDVDSKRKCLQANWMTLSENQLFKQRRKKIGTAVWCWIQTKLILNRFHCNSVGNISSVSRYILINNFIILFSVD